MAGAMDDGGLITPVRKKADQTDIYELSRQWKDLVGKARAKKLAPDEYSTGTFTMSNLGMFGVSQFDAILPPGQGGIMAVSSAIPTVCAMPDGSTKVRKIMKVTLTADHRTVMGKDGAAFLVAFRDIVENPEQLVF